MNIVSLPSPNWNSRKGHAVDMLVLHYTNMPTAQEALDRLCDKAAEVSAHYVVDEDGTIYQLVDEKNRAWHAGVSFWRGHTNINQRSIGIEMVNPGHTWGYRPFTKPQMESVTALCKEIVSRHPIPPRNVVGHSDICPTREDKMDPGVLFDWKGLALADIGLWPDLSGKRPKSDNANSCSIMSYALAEYGYDTTDIAKTITSFQRHFRPSLLNGEWDGECAGLLASLLKLI